MLVYQRVSKFHHPYPPGAWYPGSQAEASRRRKVMLGLPRPQRLGPGSASYGPTADKICGKSLPYTQKINDDRANDRPEWSEW